MEPKFERKWILIEAVICTLPATILLILVLPFIGFGLIEFIFPVRGDQRSIIERFIALLPYVSGVFGIVNLWRLTIFVNKGERVYFDYIFFLAFLAGTWASYELYSVAPITIQVVVLLPLWLFVTHLLLVNKLNT